MAGMDLLWTLRPATENDATWMAELRAAVMRPDLERLGRFDEARVRDRFLQSYAPGHTRVIVVDARDVGLVAVRPEDERLWVEHFYLSPQHQGRGIGGQVLEQIRRENRSRALWLDVLQGSPARRLYERHGFVADHEDAIDVFMTAAPLRG